MKKTLSIILTAVMILSLVPCCLFASAAVSVSVKSTYTIEPGVTYTNFNITSGQNGNTVTGVAMQFNPKDGYIPMTFGAYAGNVGTLQSQYSVATSAKYGYDVAGLINGSYFTMSKGELDYANISNGKLTCAHVDQYNREVVAFDKDGNMKSVYSKLEFKLYANGTELPNAIYAINKRYENNKSKAPYAVYYYDTSCGTTTDTNEPGYEIVCQKVNGTDIAVGKTLMGKVVEVKANSYGTKFESNSNVQSDKFVLYVNAASNFANTLKNLKAGDDISILVNETNAAARSTMENAHSTITNVGWLVKNGVDQTRTQSTIGGHSVTDQFRQTAFGQKPDGTYVFFTSEGASTGANGSLTLRDVADYFMAQGCTNVIRMDAGGSSAMYVKNKANSGSAGYAQSSSRAVADTIMVVKKSSIKTPEVETPDVPTGTNVALNKTYSGANVSTAGSYSANLTDGTASDVQSYNSNWFGLYYNPSATSDKVNAPGGVGEIIIDLEAVKNGITDVRVHVWNCNASGIASAKSMKLLTSKDGTNYTEIGKINIPSINAPAWATIKTDKISARYVKILVETQATWTFLNEIEVYADPNYVPETGDPEISEPETPDPEERENIALNKDYEAQTYGLYTAKLTDGVALDVMKYDDNWFAFYNNGDANVTNAPGKVGTVIIDLDGSFDITGVKINSIQNITSGVGLPAAIKVYLSKDGQNWGTATELSIPAVEDTVKDVAFAIKDDISGKGSYIKFEFVLGENSFVFFNEIEVYGTEAEVEDPGISEPDGTLGDVDDDGDVDAADYVLVKRAVLKTYELDEEQFAVADVDGDGDVDATDYVLIKRIVLGTYTVK